MWERYDSTSHHITSQHSAAQNLNTASNAVYLFLRVDKPSIFSTQTYKVYGQSKVLYDICDPCVRSPSYFQPVVEQSHTALHMHPPISNPSKLCDCHLACTCTQTDQVPLYPDMCMMSSNIVYEEWYIQVSSHSTHEWSKHESPTLVFDLEVQSLVCKAICDLSQWSESFYTNLGAHAKPSISMHNTCVLSSVVQLQQRQRQQQQQQQQQKNHISSRSDSLKTWTVHCPMLPHESWWPPVTQHKLPSAVWRSGLLAVQPCNTQTDRQLSTIISNSVIAVVHK